MGTRRIAAAAFAFGIATGCGDDGSGAATAETGAATSDEPTSGNPVTSTTAATTSTADDTGLPTTAGPTSTSGDTGGGSSDGGTTGEPLVACGTATQLSTGQVHACAIRDDATLWCWGGNDHGQIGDGSYDDQPVPVEIPLGVDVTSVSAGDSVTCATTTGGKLWCWGNNSAGAVGDGTAAGEDCGPQVCAPTPTLVTPPGSTMVQTWPTTSHPCASDDADALWCWGSNADGQVTNTVMGNVPSPLLLGAIGPVAAAQGGSNHTCALTTGGTVQCWGNNDNGKFGTGMVGGTLLNPTEVSGLVTPIAAMATGSEHACVIDGDGAMACWGGNYRGQLGLGTLPDPEPSPQLVPGLPALAAISAGGPNTCALGRDGSLWCWGWNTYGQVGDGTHQGINCGVGGQLLYCRTSPVEVTALGPVSLIDVGYAFSCALDSDGAPWCWGADSQGRLGTGELGDTCYGAYTCIPEPAKVLLPCP